MHTNNKLFIITLLTSTFLVSSNLFAANGSINITGTQNSDYIASNNVVGSSFDTFTANSSSAIFKQDFINNRDKEIKDSVLNFSGKSVKGDVIGLNRGNSYDGKTTKSNTINITGGTINGDVLATSDKSGYNKTDRRESNIINFSNGNIGGKIEGGAGATNNIITITGGILGNEEDDDSGETCKSGSIYAGVSDIKTQNKSTNGTVILRNMSNNNNFLSNFTEGSDGLSGMIFGSNLNGTSNLNFEDIIGTYNGGFKNFNTVFLNSNSSVILGGSSYYADNWNIDGHLNTNGTVAHTYNNTTLNLNVRENASVTQKFLSDASVNAINAGTINGIKTDKNITLNNSGRMTGEYTGNTVNINNEGIINSTIGQNTVISSVNSGILNNTGQIKQSISFAGKMTVNNNTNGLINAQIINTQDTLNINNTGTISTSSIFNLNDSKTTNINNNINGVISNGLTLTNGILNLNNQSGAHLSDNSFTATSGAFNLSNSGTMNGISSLTAIDGGVFNLVNNATGNITGDLTINSGISTFTNNGTFNNLNITNHQNGVILNNNKDIKGAGSILSDTNFTLNNNSGANITGNQTWKNVTFSNSNGATVNNLDLTSNSGTVNISNSGTYSGNNSISSINNGTTVLLNNATGNITGDLTINSGIDTFTNNGTFNNLNITNHQNGVILNNNKDIKGAGSILSDTNFTLNNNSGANITGNQTWKNVTFSNSNGATVNNLDLTSNSGTVNISNSGTYSGNNSISSINNGTTVLLNNATGNITGDLTINSGIDTFTNNGTFNNLNIINHQNGVILNNNKDIKGAGSILSDTNFTLNNNSGANITGNQTWKNVTFSNSNGATVNNLDLTSNSGTVNISNSGTYSGNNSISSVNSGTATFNNLSNGLLTGSLDIVNLSMALQNAPNASISNLHLTADNSTVNVQNSGRIEGTNIIEGVNNGIIKLVNKIGGNIKDTLNIKYGVETFNNEGSMTDLTINNEQLSLDIYNEGIISGTNSLNNAINQTITVTNKTGGKITGNLNTTNGSFNLSNNTDALLYDLNYNNTNATSIISNAGTMNGQNSLQNNGGTLIFSNAIGGILGGQLTVLSEINPISNFGTINGLNLYNTYTSILDLNNTGLLTGSNILKNINLNNKDGGFVVDSILTSDTQGLNIFNNGTFSGNNVLTSINNGSTHFDNNNGGKITGILTVNGGLNNINNTNGATISDLELTANQEYFTINNTGSISGNNILTSQNNFSIINSGAGEINSNLILNSTITTLEQNSTGNFLSNLYANSSANTLNIINSTFFNGTLNGTIGTINLININPSNTSANLILTNNGNINSSLNVNNKSYTKINNHMTLSGALDDKNSPTVSDTQCPVNTIELNNSGNISGDMNILNNIFKFDNTGNVTSNTIDTRDLRLINSGTISSENNYAFSVRGHIDANNTTNGIIYGKNYAFKLLGKPIAGSDVKGVINNNGTIYSQGTTIGYDQSNIPCPSCYGSDLVINNYGRLVSVDIATLTNPDLNSHAISAENAIVNNYNGGLIGGSIHVKEYNQKSGSTWVSFLDKDLSQMSTIIAEDKINIEQGSTLTIYTNNDVKAFTNNQEFKLIEAKNMSQNAIDEQIEKFTIRTDSPFANYQMIGKNTDEGYIVFNHVSPTTYATAADLSTSSHHMTILGSQRIYELFVNRDINQVQGRSGGNDLVQANNKLNFMPIGGYTHQGDKGGHAGYSSSYYGGLGYFEHDFNNNFKGGIGFAYMNNNTDFNDVDKSDGKIDSYRPFAYINYETDFWRVDLAGGFAKHQIDNNRKYSFNDKRYLAKGKYDADEISGHLNIGYKIALANDVLIQPMIGAYAAKLKTDTFSETGLGPMNMRVKSEDYNSFKSMVGIKLKKDYKLNIKTTIKPELHLRWHHELGDTKGGVNAYFLAQEQLFNTSGIETPKDIGDVAFRLTTKTGTNFDFFTEAYYQFGNKFYNAGGTVGLQYNF